jgi:hypothetical protein
MVASSQPANPSPIPTSKKARVARRFRFWAGVDGGVVRGPGVGLDGDMNWDRFNDSVLAFLPGVVRAGGGSAAWLNLSGKDHVSGTTMKTWSCADGGVAIRL